MKKEETKLENKIIETVATKGKKGSFIIRTVAETNEVVNSLKELSDLDKTYSAAITEITKRCDDLQEAINTLSANGNCTQSLKVLINELDVQKGELGKGVLVHNRIKEVIKICKEAK